jgi:hypothetical protein
MPLYRRPDDAPENTLTPEELEENTPGVPDNELSAEEKTWKKRYGDLRSHTQKQINELNNTLNNLKAQLATTASNQLQLPTSTEDVEAWAKKYPQVAAIVETIALSKAKKINEGVEAKLQILETRENENAAERAKINLKKIHPEFDEIAEDEAFHNWLASKSKRTQDTIYENDLDYEAAAETLSLFKLETNWGKKAPRRENPADAGREVRTRNETRPSNGVEPMFKESQIMAMDGKTYEKMEPEIDKAQREGRIEYDITNAKDAARG